MKIFILTFRDRCKQRIERQLGIIGKAATDNEIEEMIEQSKDGKNLQIFTGVSKNDPAIYRDFLYSILITINNFPEGSLRNYVNIVDLAA